MINQSPGVRRLCVCVVTPYPGLLDSACRTGGLDELYTEYSQAESIEMGFASPGVDEAALVTDLISALHTTAAESRGVPVGPDFPVLAAFHVGITRVEGDDLGGAAVARIRELLRYLALIVLPNAMPEVLLVVGISASLFDDIGSECGFAAGWILLARARAWFHSYGPDRSAREGGPTMWYLEDRI